MEVIKWNKTKRERAGFMIRINPEEAIKIIQSLSAQLADKNPNSGRLEFFTEKGEYFSIAVEDPSIPHPDELEVAFVYDKIKKEGEALLHH